MKKQVTLKSGHTLTINIASLDDCQNLANVFGITLVDLRLSVSKEVIQAFLFGPPTAADESKEAYAARKSVAVMQTISGDDATFLMSLIMKMLAARALQDAIMICASTCMLNAMGPDEQVARASFQPEKARRDFFPVLLEVMKANLRPFFDDLFGGLLTPSQQNFPPQK